MSTCGAAGEEPCGGADQRPSRGPGEARGGVGADRDLLSALAGTQAGQDRSVAYRTCRVVNASMGLMREQQAGRKRIRGVALAAILLVVLLLGPMVWCSVDRLIAGERWGDVTSQFALWVAILCPALVGAALVAGWMRHRP
ncbi:MAG: hypothetical protein P4L26_14705 [Terracidiphilus sp.]|nr:hypothetical protein [Terracidiphilus sp.]